MDNTTIYEFLQEKSVTPTGPGSYSDSTEMSNALKAFKKNSSLKTKGKKDVNFYDYDGLLVDSYSAEEFLQLSAMPVNPSHDGLTAQGWNYSLADAKEYVEKYGRLDVGQMYITDDGKTRIYISLKDGRLKPLLGLGISGSVVVDWGDGSATDTMTGSDTATTVYQEHTYSAEGEYVISLNVTGAASINEANGCSSLMGKISGNSSTNKAYWTAIAKVELGEKISIGSSAFSGCYSLTSVTIPNNVTSIGSSVFSGCSSLTSVTIPKGVTSIGQYAFSGCNSLTSVTIPESVTSIDNNVFSNCYSLTSVTIPKGVTSIGSNAFTDCYSLTSVTIPESVTSISSSVFSGCYSLTSIIIPNNVTSIGNNAFTSCTSLTSVTIPESVTSIDNNVFSSCCSLTSVTIPKGVTSIGQYAFSHCHSLTSVTIPESVTSIDNNVFSNCYSLTSVTIPESVTSIGSEVFSRCCSLTSVTIPESVTSIGQYAFSGCYGLGFIKFIGSTPAAVSQANAWSSIPTDCIIYVPQGSLLAYTSASNYPSSSTYTYVEY